MDFNIFNLNAVRHDSNFVKLYPDRLSEEKLHELNSDEDLLGGYLIDLLIKLSWPQWFKVDDWGDEKVGEVILLFTLEEMVKRGELKKNRLLTREDILNPQKSSCFYKLNKKLSA